MWVSVFVMVVMYNGVVCVCCLLLVACLFFGGGEPRADGPVLAPRADTVTRELRMGLWTQVDVVVVVVVIQ